MITPSTAARGLKVALVYPPYGAVRNEPGIKVVKDNYGLFPSLSLLYVAGALEALGCRVLVVDAHADGLSVPQVVERLQAFGPDLVGYNLTTYLFHQTTAWIRAIRERLDVPVMVGGVHLSLYPEETLALPYIDYGVTGEAEVILPELLPAIVDGSPLDDVAGVAWRVGETVRVTPPAPMAEVDGAPWPARHLVDNSVYYSFISQRRNFTPLMTSRGCPFRCIFCEQGSKRYRARRPADVVDEIEHVVREHGVRELDFFDSAFTIERQRVLAICEEITRRRLPVVWAARSRVDTVDAEMLRAMRRAGCTRIYYGIESGTPRILEVLRKDTDLQRVKEILVQTRRAGIHTFGYFMVGSPYETLETVADTVRLALDLDLDYAQFSKVTPMPGTELYRMLLDETGRDWWREILLGGEELEVPRPHCSLTELEVEREIRRAYLRFYFRPRYILRALARVRSLDELTRSARTALQMAIRPPGPHDETGGVVHD